MSNLKLSKPIHLESGETVETLSLDFDSLALIDIKNARKVKALFTDSKDVDPLAAASPRLDSDLRVALAWVAAVKADKRLKTTDVLQLSALDAMSLSEICFNDWLFL